MEEPQDQQDNENPTKVKQWVGNNSRLIVSIIIVLIIFGGIYSYSQRSQESEIALQDDDTQEESLLFDETMETSEEAGIQEPATESEHTPSGSDPATENRVSQVPQVTSTESKETTDAFIETAQSGDGLTHLARRALANHLEKNSDSQITVAHKIYIEDYLRKQVGHTGLVTPGTQVGFSKNLIEDAISSAKNLTDGQLKNLEKYVPLVPSLA